VTIKSTMVLSRQELDGAMVLLRQEHDGVITTRRLWRGRYCLISVPLGTDNLEEWTNQARVALARHNSTVLL
jgi:hypothetical protein